MRRSDRLGSRTGDRTLGGDALLVRGAAPARVQRGSRAETRGGGETGEWGKGGRCRWLPPFLRRVETLALSPWLDPRFILGTVGAYGHPALSSGLSGPLRPAAGRDGRRSRSGRAAPPLVAPQWARAASSCRGGGAEGPVAPACGARGVGAAPGRLAGRRGRWRPRVGEVRPPAPLAPPSRPSGPFGAPSTGAGRRSAPLWVPARA